MSRPRFFVPDATQSGMSFGLPEDETHHALHVLRLREGAEVGVFDGRGHEWIARVVTAGQWTGVTVELAGAVEPAAEPPVQVTLAAGLLKGDQMDAVVRDATMLGVAAIVPMSTEHVVVPARIRGAGAVQRWQRVAVASAKQCGRAVVPNVEPIESVTSVLERKDAGARLMCVEPLHARARAIAIDSVARPARALVLVGPEGGWSAAEIMIAEGAGATLVNLGPRTLRADAAPTVMLSALWTVWGWR